MVTTWRRGLTLLTLVLFVTAGLLTWAADAAKPVVGTIKSVDKKKK